MADSGWSAMRLAPQRTQKLAPSEFRMPHSGQNTSALPGILSGRLVFPRPEAGEDARELLHVVGGDDGLPLLVLVLEAHHEFGVQDVELALQDAPAARDLALWSSSDRETRSTISSMAHLLRVREVWVADSTGPSLNVQAQVEVPRSGRRGQPRRRPEASPRARRHGRRVSAGS